MLAILIICLVIFGAISLPIGIAMGLATMLCLVFATNIDPIMVAQNAFAGIDSFSLMGHPLLHAGRQLHALRRHLQAPAGSGR